MCKTPCNDPRCALFAGPVCHYTACNPSVGKVDSEYAECCNVELTRQVNNIATGPYHVRALNFCPPPMCPGEFGIFDPPQKPICF